jgi:GTPase
MIEFANRKFLLTDTVGFIDRLPIALIEAFRSTLEETIFSDLIVIVVDFAEPIEKIEMKNNVCLETIELLGASGIPTITALNKVDLVKPEEREPKLVALKDKIRNPLFLSAKCGTNLEELKKQVLRILENFTRSQFTIPLTGNFMPFISWVHQKADIHQEKYTNNSLQIVFEASGTVTEQVKKKVEELNGKFQTCPTQ